MSRRVPKTLTAAILVAGLAGLSLAAPARAQDTVLRLHHLLPPTAPIPKLFLQPWAEKVEELSEGRIKVQLFPSMQLGGAPAQLFDQAASGMVDIVWTLPGYSAGRFAATEAIELPFMTCSAAGSTKALWRYFEENDLAGNEYDGVKVLALHTSGVGHIHTNGRAVKTLDDFEGLTIRAPNRQSIKFLEAMGATPIGMPITSMAEALSKHVIDGVLFQWETAPVVRLADLTEYHSESPVGEPGLYNLSYVMVMNQRSYDKLSPEDRAVIDSVSGMEASLMGANAQASYINIGRNSAVDHGNEIVTLDKAELARWRELAAGSEAEWADDAVEAGYDPAMLMASLRESLSETDCK